MIDRVATELRSRVTPWLQTREGVACVSVFFGVSWVLWAALGAPLITAVLIAAFLAVLVSLAARLWESLTAPDATPFSRAEDPVQGGVKVQQDSKAGFWRDGGGFLGGNRIWFAGTGCPPCQLRPDTYLQLRAWRAQADLPVFVARAGQRQWWWWGNAFYWEAGDCRPDDVAALLEMLERDDEQAIEWEFEAHLATPIPRDVRHLVYERDRGRCLACGSAELVQYDRVTPWSTGGGNEPRNIRLLCARCTRRRTLGRQDRTQATSGSA